MRTRFKVVGLMTLLCSLFGCAADQTRDRSTSTVLARYGQDSQTLTEAQWAQWQSTRQEYLKIQDLAQPEAMILQRTLAEAARQQGLHQDPELLVQHASKLISWAFPKVRQHLHAQVQIDEIRVEQLFEALKNRPRKPAKVRLYNLFRRFPNGASEADKQRLRDWMQSQTSTIEGLEDFRAVALQYSESESRFREGLIGNVPPGMLQDEFDRVAMALQANQMSSVIETEDGLTVLYAEQWIEPPRTSDAVLHERALGQVRREAETERVQHYQQKLLDQANLQILWPQLDCQMIQGSDPIVLTHAFGELRWSQLSVLIKPPQPCIPLDDARRAQISRRVTDHVLGLAMLEDLERSWPEFDEQVHLVSDYILDDMLSARMLLQEVSEVFVEPSEAELRAHFAANQASYQVPRQYRVRAMHWALSNENPAEAVRRAHHAIDRINRGEATFESLASVHSHPELPMQSGDLGWHSQHNLSRMMGIRPVKAILSLSPGQISQPVRSDRGSLWVFRLEGVREPRQLSFEEASGQVRNSLGQSRLEAVEQEVIAAWLEAQSIEWQSPR